MKRPSVDLAIQILDGTPFREKTKQTMTIQEARFEFKGTPKQTKKPKSKKPKKVFVDLWTNIDSNLDVERRQASRLGRIRRPLVFSPDHGYLEKYVPSY